MANPYLEDEDRLRRELEEAETGPREKLDAYLAQAGGQESDPAVTVDNPPVEEPVIPVVSPEHGPKALAPVPEEVDYAPLQQGLAGLSQGMYAATTKGKLGDDFFKRVGAIGKSTDNKDPLLDLKRKLLEQKLAGKAAKPIAPDEDPNSEESRLAQITLTKSRPDFVEKLGGSDAVRRMSKKLIYGSSGVVNPYDRREGFTESQRKTDIANENSDLTRADIQDGRKQVQKRFEVQQLQELGKLGAKYAPLAVSFKEIERLAPGFLYGKVPEGMTVGTFTEQLKRRDPTGIAKNEHFSKQEDLALRGAIENAKDLIIRLRTGAVINDQEQANYGRMLNDALVAGPGAMAAVFPLLRKELAAKMASEQGTYYLANPEGFQEWSRETGTPTYKDDLFNPKAETPMRSGPIETSTQTQEPSPEQLQSLQGAPAGSEIRVPPPAARKPATPAAPPALPPALKGKIEAAKKSLQPGEILVLSNGQLQVMAEDEWASDPEFQKTFKRVGP